MKYYLEAGVVSSNYFAIPVPHPIYDETVSIKIGAIYYCKITAFIFRIFLYHHYDWYEMLLYCIWTIQGKPWITFLDTKLEIFFDVEYSWKIFTRLEFF